MKRFVLFHDIDDSFKLIEPITNTSSVWLSPSLDSIYPLKYYSKNELQSTLDHWKDEISDGCILMLEFDTTEEVDEYILKCLVLEELKK